MYNSTIALKPVKELLGMNFFIRDYQRGYRWTAQQATDLLEDIWEFADKEKGHAEIYCLQPLVVQKKTEDIKKKIGEKMDEDGQAFAACVEKILKGSWNVVDGQQRLTTIYLILTALGEPVPYEIDYETRHNSKEFLSNIKNENSSDNAMQNIDYFHMYNVYREAVKWLEKLGENNKKTFRNCLLKNVNVIWYQIPAEENDGSRTNAIAAFERLNIGKIPLTDAELIKALFLNRTNFDYDSVDLEMQQRKIASEWDQIEYTLQDDAFWFFLNGKEYDKPTRIDYILDLICEEQQKPVKNNKDEHRTFRFFYEAFKGKGASQDILKARWEDICEYFRIFNEWFHDYKLYHYIGYLNVVSEQKNLIADLVSMWKYDPKDNPKAAKKKPYNSLDGSKEKFIEAVKMMIRELLEKNDGFKDLENFKYDEEYNDGKNKHNVQKAKCVPILLLHNIETIIQQNEKLVEDARYGMPNFTRFPFHLYKAEKWEVEHIRPNAGDKLDKIEDQKNFLNLAKTYLPDKDDLHRKIDQYLLKEDKAGDGFAEVLDAVLEAGDALADEDKNKIWNYTLLDKKTNIEYGNAIFPVKRAFLANKERGYKTKIENGKLNRSKQRDEVAFVLPCTRNVFAKFYTDEPNGLLSWTEQDARAYLEDMRDKLAYYRGEN